MTFKELVTTLEKIPDILRGPHFITQSLAITSTSNKRKIRVFKLEDNRVELTEFLKQRGLAMKHQNKNSLRYNYMGFYDPESLELTKRIHEKDIVQFGYHNSYDAIVRSFSEAKLINPNPVTWLNLIVMRDTQLAGLRCHHAETYWQSQALIFSSFFNFSQFSICSFNCGGAF